MAGGFDIKNGDIIYGVMEDKFGNSALIVQKSDYSRVMAEIELDSGDGYYVNKVYEYIHWLKADKYKGQVDLAFNY